MTPPPPPAERIASLVPSATEMCAALGLTSRLAAVTHECDFPPGIEALPHLTRTVIEPGLSAAGIDAAVRERTERGEALYELDEETLARIGPDLILAQQVCAVCAVSYEDVAAVAARLPGAPPVLSLDPQTLGEVVGDAARLGDAAGRPEAGERLARSLEGRIAAVRERVAGLERPRVAALEWLDPVYAAGHWVPEMIEAAGGVDALAAPGQRSEVVTWEQVSDSEPEVVVVMPCGLYTREARDEALAHRARLAGVGAGRAYAVDAAASFSRPGPRLADGVELLAHLLHPARARAPGTLSFEPLELAQAG